MSKIFLFMMVSLDGYFEGPDHDLSWHNVDAEFQKFAIEQLSEVSTIFFGQKTYTMMASFWPSEQARKADPQTAELMNTLPKIVFSKTLTEVKEGENWKNVTLKHEVNAAKIKKLKEESDKDIAIFGSNNLSVSFLEKGLLDELRIMVNPVILGKGNSLFIGLKKKVKLNLQKERNFKSGNVLLYYKPE